MSKVTRKEFLGLNRMQMGIWEAAEYLNKLVDDSDPDTDMSQLEHLLQTAELIVRSALHRHESRGLHYTLDYPQTAAEAVDTVLVP